MSPPVERVLLWVDDRPHLLRFRQTLLGKQGYIVITATSAATAITKLETCWVDAVLLEYNSEGMDAEAVAFQIKNRFPDQPVILLSAYSCTPERVLRLVDEYVMESEPIQEAN